MNNNQNSYNSDRIGIKSEHSLINVVLIDLAFKSALISKSACSIITYVHKENQINYLMVTNDKYYNFLKLKFTTDCMEESNYE